MTTLTAVFLFVTGIRFDKYHRQEETWQYRILWTTMANIKADAWVRAMKGKES